MSNWKEWCTLLRHMAKTWGIESNQYIGKSIYITNNQIEQKGISTTSLETRLFFHCVFVLCKVG